MNSKYYLAVIATFTIYGFFSIPLKAIDQYPSLDILLSRLSMASVLIVLFSLFFRKKQSLKSINIFKYATKKEKRHLLTVNLASSVMLAINWYLFIYVMNNVSVNATSLAYMLCPIINTVLAYIFLKDRLTSIQWIAILLSVFSCVLLSFGNFSETIYAFVVGLSYAIYLVLQKNNNQLDRFFTLTFQIVCSTIMLLPLFTFQNPQPIKGSFFFGIVFIIAAFFTIIPMYLNVFSLNRLSSSTAGIFIYLNPILSFLLAVLYFNEPISPVKTIAYSIVFISVLLFNIRFILKTLKVKMN